MLALSVRSGLVGDLLLPPAPAALYPTAEGRDQKYPGWVNCWAMRRLPMVCPLPFLIKEPSAVSGETKLAKAKMTYV